MLSYRHAYHAGNHADVLKHVVWCEILRYLAQKDKPFYVQDTHAGAGLYDVSSEMMQKKQEYISGAVPLMRNAAGLQSSLLQNYVDIVRGFNPDTDDLQTYPGSPSITQKFLRVQDRLLLTDLHGTELPQLKALFKGDKRVSTRQADGYEVMISALPPKEGRGAVLIDPSYEVKDEYQTLPNRLGKALTRFPNGVYAIWYPVLGRTRTESFIKQLSLIIKSKNTKNSMATLRAELNVSPDREEGFGMVGSGMFIINPPYTLKADLDLAMPELLTNIAPQTGRFIIEENK